MKPRGRRITGDGAVNKSSSHEQCTAWPAKARLLATVCACALAFSAPALAQQQKTVTYDIPASSLADALNAFGVQSELRLGFGSAAVAGKRAPELKGSFEPTKALEILLRGSGLTFRHTSNNT